MILRLCLILFVLWVWWGNSALKTTQYKVRSSRVPEAFDGFRIAHVSDLHNTDFGNNHKKLISQLQKAQPDIIAITGDLVDGRRTDIAVALAFVAQAVEIAPCYYVPGNHEGSIPNYKELKEGLLELGVHVLQNARVDLERQGQTLAILGVNDFNVSTEGFTESFPKTMELWIRDLWRAGESYSVLLSHHPEYFASYMAAGVDLTLTGHAHGGQFRLPLIGGLFAPGQGAFPKYDAGLYRDGEKVMAVSRGIGNSSFPFRFNNRPDLLLLVLENK